MEADHRFAIVGSHRGQPTLRRLGLMRPARHPKTAAVAVGCTAHVWHAGATGESQCRLTWMECFQAGWKKSSVLIRSKMPGKGHCIPFVWHMAYVIEFGDGHQPFDHLSRTSLGLARSLAPPALLSALCSPLSLYLAFLLVNYTIMH